MFYNFCLKCNLLKLPCKNLRLTFATFDVLFHYKDLEQKMFDNSDNDIYIDTKVGDFSNNKKSSYLMRRSIGAILKKNIKVHV